VTKVSDPLILNTLAEDTAESHEAALLKIYARLVPATRRSSTRRRRSSKRKFFDENRYRLGRVGRFRINRKFDQNVPETVMTLRSGRPRQLAEVHVQAA
jgi:DNA-directed RNA polymerase subunit beta